MSEEPARPHGRVLVILHEEVLGGATISVLRCVPGLRERGWEFAFWVPPGPVFDELAERGERVAGQARPHAYSFAQLRVGPGPWWRIRSLPGYRRAFRGHLEDELPALVHANSHVTLADAIIARGAGIPTAIHLHEIFGSGRKWDIGRRLVERYGDAVIAVSEACADALATDSYRPRVVHNGVELPPERAVPAPDRPFTVGTVAAISRRKGIDVLVEAVGIVRAREPRISFELVGSTTDPLDADWGKAQLARARELGIEHLASADVGARLANWDCFVLPSRRDPFPLSSLEAMAHGVPVIAARVDGLREQVTPESGRLVSPEDPQALAAAILEFAALPAEDRAAIGAAARERVASEFTIEKQVEGIDAAWRAAVGR